MPRAKRADPELDELIEEIPASMQTKKPHASLLHTGAGQLHGGEPGTWIVTSQEELTADDSGTVVALRAHG